MNESERPSSRKHFQAKYVDGKIVMVEIEHEPVKPHFTELKPISFSTISQKKSKKGLKNKIRKKSKTVKKSAHKKKAFKKSKKKKR